MKTVLLALFKKITSFLKIKDKPKVYSEQEKTLVRLNAKNRL